ncbi:MAG: diguanylate cyclase [Gammaproteobacteria bacterium]|nr:diguanylate cyclase [Gammaproteobacteria bacterium]
MISNFRILMLFSSGFVLVLCLIVLLVYYSLKQSDNLKEKINSVEQEYLAKNQALTTVAQNSHKRTMILLKMYHTSDVFERNELFDEFYALAHVVAKANRVFVAFDLPEEERKIHQHVFTRMKKSSAIRSHITELLMEGKDEKALALINNDSVKSQSQVLEIIEKLQLIQVKNHKAYLDKLIQQQKDNILRISILGLMLFILFTVLVLFTLRYIFRKENIIVKQAEVALECVSQGVIITDQTGVINYLNPFAEVVLQSVDCQAKNQYFDKLELFYSKNEMTPISDIVAHALADKKKIQRYNQCYIRSDKYDIFLWFSLTVASIIGKKNEFLGIVIVFTDISEVTALNDKLKFSASHDKLTGLYNRSIVEEKIEEVVSKSVHEKSNSILMYIDLDNFKAINDTAGHHAGDQLLIDIATLFKSQVREYDLVGRIGGDEFNILMYRCSLEQGKLIADKIIQSVHDYRLQWEGNNYQVGTSIGLTCIDGTSDNAEQVAKNADRALYDAKEAGKNCYRIS